MGPVREQQTAAVIGKQMYFLLHILLNPHITYE